MAQDIIPDLTREHVFEVCEKLASTGSAVSGYAARKLIGHGSQTTARKYAEEWKSQNSKGVLSMSAPKTIMSQIEQLIQDHVERMRADEKAAFQARIAEKDETIARLELDILRANAAVTSTINERDAANAEAADLRAKLADAEQRCRRAVAERSSAEAHRQASYGDHRAERV